MREKKSKSEPNEKKRDKHQVHCVGFSFCETRTHTHTHKQIKQQEKKTDKKKLSSRA
jgi:hypothetical protein